MKHNTEPPDLFEDVPARPDGRGDDDPLLQMFAVGSSERPGSTRHGAADSAMRRPARTLRRGRQRDAGRILARRAVVVCGGTLAALIAASLALGDSEESEPSARTPERAASTSLGSGPAGTSSRAPAANRLRTEDALDQRSSPARKRRKPSRTRNQKGRDESTRRERRPAASHHQTAAPAPTPQPVATASPPPSQTTTSPPGPRSSPTQGTKPQGCEYPPC